MTTVDLREKDASDLRSMFASRPLPQLVVVDGTEVDEVSTAVLAASIRLRRLLLSQGGGLVLVGPACMAAVRRCGLQWSLPTVESSAQLTAG